MDQSTPSKTWANHQCWTSCKGERYYEIRRSQQYNEDRDKAYYYEEGTPIVFYHWKDDPAPFLLFVRIFGKLLLAKVEAVADVRGSWLEAISGQQGLLCLSFGTITLVDVGDLMPCEPSPHGMYYIPNFGPI